MSDAERVSSLVRAGAGDALARLGDSRFLKNAWFLPNDPILGLVEVPAGPFRMGSDKKRDSRAYDDETPQHEVTLPSYYIGRYPVTVAQFRTYVEDGGRTPEDPESVRGLANHPVVRVTWHEALAYCRWLAETLGASNETPAALRRVLQGDGVERPWQVTSRGGVGEGGAWHRRSHVGQRGRYGRELRRHEHQPNDGGRLLPNCRARTVSRS